VPSSEQQANPTTDANPPVARRRSVSQRVREARDQLTSTTGTRATFDYELLRQFADNRVSASLMILFLVATVGFMSSFWAGAINAGIWTFAVLVIHVITVAKCRQFLASSPTGLNLRAWQMRFTILDLFHGLAWMYILIDPAGHDERSGTFMLFIMLLIVAVSSMVASSLPIAAFAATMPVTFAVALNFALRATLQDFILALMVLVAQGYFMMLIKRLYSSGVATLVARAEKDALIGELEEAKENAEEARRRAESASVAKSQFLAQMSHELRTPLNAILGFSEVMKTEVFGEHAVPAYKEYSNDIHTSGQHLLNLINEVLDLSRIEAGRYELNEDAVSLISIVEDCHHLLRLRAQNRGIAIHQVFEPNLPRLWADERAIRQVCLNLLSNAVKFTPPGGEIWLKVGWTAAGGQYMSVKDTGPGIPEDEIAIVLSKFGQGSNAIKSAEQGTGLGLPIAKNLIELHGGTFVLKSKVRIGTELIATFPPERVMSALAPIKQAAPPIQPEPAQPERPKKRISLFKLRA
jgi:two-component system, cell cycle sensor histidine kinase PleC